jgi:hypothetical protein
MPGPDDTQTRRHPGFETILWRALIRTQPRKVELFLRRFGKALGTEVRLERCEPYWKDRSLVDIRFTSPLNASDIRQATFEALLLCQRLLPQWTVTGPTSYEGDRWEFYGSSRDEVRGLVMMEIWVRNFSTEWSGIAEQEKP